MHKKNKIYFFTLLLLLAPHIHSMHNNKNSDITITKVYKTKPESSFFTNSLTSTSCLVFFLKAIFSRACCCLSKKQNSKIVPIKEKLSFKEKVGKQKTTMNMFSFEYDDNDNCISNLGSFVKVGKNFVKTI